MLDRRANVVGVVVAKLDAMAVASRIGDIPQNVNFAIAARLATAFLATQGVAFNRETQGTILGAADVGDVAKAYTLAVSCAR